MKKEIADKWIAALRSGKYIQGKYALQTTDGNMCCLGVLCDLYSSNSWDKTNPESYYNDVTQESVKYNVFVGLNGQRDSSFLSNEVVLWSEMKSGNGYIKSDKFGSGYIDLAELNDKANWNFTLIANFIEENWEQL